jgi:glycine/D-amino acid oxidase-like deaminating enzyme
MLSLGFEPEAEFVWSGTASVTSDFLPHIFELGTGIHAITACNGRGLALSTAVGQAVGRALLTREFDQLPIKLQRPGRISGRSVRILGTHLYPIYGSIKKFLGI